MQYIGALRCIIPVNNVLEPFFVLTFHWLFGDSGEHESGEHELHVTEATHGKMSCLNRFGTKPAVTRCLPRLFTCRRGLVCPGLET